MGFDKQGLEKSYWDKKYKDMMDKLRRESEEKTRLSLSAQKAGIKEAGKNRREADQKLQQIVEHKRGSYGMESYYVLIMQMVPFWEAWANRLKAKRIHYTKRAWLAISENFNYQDFTLLGLTAEAARRIRANLDWYLNTEGNFIEELDPLCVPYLADVNDEGVLNIDLDVDNQQMTTEDKDVFVAQHNADLQASIEGWINGSTYTENSVAGPVNYQLAVENVAGKQKIRMQAPGPAAGVPAPAAVYMSKQQFREFRANVIQPQLVQRFGVDFKPFEPEPPQANNVPGATGP